MNVILFGLKRAFQCSIRFTRSLVGAFGLTAARFDMLHAIKRSYQFSIRQSELRRTLGVSAPTVSRMLGSLEKLGLVTRARPSRDTRQRIVTLTAVGVACMRRAFKSIVRRRVVRTAYDKVLTVGLLGEPGARFTETCNAESVCDRIRRGFGDTSTLNYPWHPDD